VGIRGAANRFHDNVHVICRNELSPILQNPGALRCRLDGNGRAAAYCGHAQLGACTGLDFRKICRYRFRGAAPNRAKSGNPDSYLAHTILL
jgi:hypothetical protein